VEPLDLVMSFCEAWSEGSDVDKLVDFFTEDATYHNIPIEPVKGRDAIKATINGFMTGVDKMEFEVKHAAVNGSVVMTERVDRFFFPGHTVALPVMGTFEVSDGKITAWRDYFDLNQFMSQMPGPAS
jgi:limonene-1,2-epoxide hydrolase